MAWHQGLLGWLLGGGDAEGPSGSFTSTLSSFSSICSSLGYPSKPDLGTDNKVNWSDSGAWEAEAQRQQAAWAIGRLAPLHILVRTNQHTK